MTNSFLYTYMQICEVHNFPRSVSKVFIAWFICCLQYLLKVIAVIREVIYVYIHIYSDLIFKMQT